MKPLQLYKTATWILLLINLSMVAFFFLAPPPPHQKGDARKKVHDMMKMDQQQNEAFLEFAQQHMQRMDDLNNQQRNLLRPYFRRLIDSTQNINSDTFFYQIQQLEREKIEATYQHFQEVKSILRPGQEASFGKFINFALDLILIGSNNEPPHQRPK